MDNGIQSFGKLLLLTGVIIAAIGSLLMLSGKLPWLGKLPGDIVIQKKNLTFYSRFEVGAVDPGVGAVARVVGAVDRKHRQMTVGLPPPDRPTHDHVMAARISQVLKECDQIISDNVQNIAYADEMGVPRDKFANVVLVPGTGGIDVEALSSTWNAPPSHRERLILWPKAYECPWSKALPVLEAIRVAWERIRPCSIYMTAAVQDEVYQWFNTLPNEIKQHCKLTDRMPQDTICWSGEARRSAHPQSVPRGARARS